MIAKLPKSSTKVNKFRTTLFSVSQDFDKFIFIDLLMCNNETDRNLFRPTTEFYMFYIYPESKLLYLFQNNLFIDSILRIDAIHDITYN